MSGKVVEKWLKSMDGYANAPYFITILFNI